MSKIQMRKIPPLDPLEYGITLNALLHYRNALVEDKKPTDDINSAIAKVYRASPKKEKQECYRE